MGIQEIIGMYELSTAEERALGRCWYPCAHGVAYDMVAVSGHGIRPPLTHAQCSAVIAAISPNNKWSRNIADGMAMAEWWSMGMVGDPPKVCSYGRCKEKAVEIMLASGDHDTDYSMMLGGRKTRSFARLIHRPGLPSTVAVDRHAIRVYRGDEPGMCSGRANVSDAEYDAAEYAYIKAAEAISERDGETTAAQVQAISWLTWRRKSGIK